MTKIMVDTNILVYAYDPLEPDKQKVAQQILQVIASQGIGVISTQVLAEFFNITTRKIKPPLTAAEAYARLETYVRTWQVIDVTGAMVLEAARGVRDYQFHFWDAQIWATARLSQVPLVLSEDFNPGSTIEGVRFENPFAPAFDLNPWL